MLEPPIQHVVTSSSSFLSKQNALLEKIAILEQNGETLQITKNTKIFPESAF